MSHKLVSLLLIVIIFLLVKNSRSPVYPQSLVMNKGYSNVTGSPETTGRDTSAKSNAFIMPQSGDYAPSESTTRIVVQNSYLSLLVKNVSETLQQIKQHAQSKGGYMVETNLTSPDEGANGTITIRVPSEQLDTTLAYLRSLSVKVVSENLQGTDVTDEYEDIDEKRKILEQNKAKLQAIMDRAVEVSDILKIQQDVFNIQSQIDGLKGRQNYLEKNAAMTKVTIYLSTDELALPYAPNNSWRPALVFKYAVRSLLANLQQFGSFLIWAAVYSIIIIPLLIALLLISRWMRRRTRLS